MIFILILIFIFAMFLIIPIDAFLKSHLYLLLRKERQLEILHINMVASYKRGSLWDMLTVNSSLYFVTLVPITHCLSYGMQKNFGCLCLEDIKIFLSVYSLSMRLNQKLALTSGTSKLQKLVSSTHWHWLICC